MAVQVDGNVLSNQVTEAQADDIQFLSKALDDLANLAITPGSRRAKVEASKMVFEWDEAVQLLLLLMPSCHLKTILRIILSC